MNLYKKKRGTYPNKKNEPTEDDHYFDGWSVHFKEGNYLLQYVSGALQGELKAHKITKEDFDLAKEGKNNLDELCTKYGIY